MLGRWLAALPVQLCQLGHRNPALSARLILSIQAAASRGNKELLSSLQSNACRIYGNARLFKIHLCSLRRCDHDTLFSMLVTLTCYVDTKCWTAVSSPTWRMSKNVYTQ